MTWKILLRRCSSAVTTRALVPLKFSELPGPKSFPLVGALPYYLPGIGKYDPSRLQVCGMMKYKEFGPIYKERMFSEEIIYIYDPSDIEKVLRNKANILPKRKTHLILEHVRNNELKEDHHNGGILMANDEEWSKLRTAFQKELTKDQIVKFIPRMDELVTGLMGRLTKDLYIRDHANKDFLQIIFAYSTDGINFFSQHWKSFDQMHNPESRSRRLIEASTIINQLTGPTDHGSNLWKYFNTPSYKKIRDCAKILDEEGKSQLDSRMQGNKLTPLGTDNLLDIWLSQGKRDYKELLTFLSDVILAGIDTVAFTLSFVVYHLSANLEAQDKLYAELCKLDPNMNVDMTSAVLGQAHYLKKALKESTRLHPLTIGVGRVLTEDAILGGYFIPNGTQIVTVNQVTSRLPKYVDFPDSFIPERFDPNSKLRSMHPFVTLPFGHGSRACIARRLAELTWSIFVFRLFRMYRVEWVGPKKLDSVSSLINSPDAPLLFTFTPRSK